MSVCQSYREGLYAFPGAAIPHTKFPKLGSLEQQKSIVSQFCWLEARKPGAGRATPSAAAGGDPSWPLPARLSHRYLDSNLCLLYRHPPVSLHAILPLCLSWFKFPFTKNTSHTGLEPNLRLSFQLDDLVKTLSANMVTLSGIGGVELQHNIFGGGGG